MPVEPTITFRHVRGDDALELDIRKRFAKIEALCPSLVAGRVLLELADRSHRGGNRFHVRIEIMVPGEDIVVDHDASVRPALRADAAHRVRKQDEAEPDLRRAKVAVRQAFEAARRRVQDRTRVRRGKVKTHQPARGA